MWLFCLLCLLNSQLNVCSETKRIYPASLIFQAELQEKLRTGHAEFHAVSAAQEPRIILVTRKNVKVRSPHSPRPRPVSYSAAHLLT